MIKRDLDFCDELIIHEDRVQTLQKDLPGEGDFQEMADLFKVFSDPGRAKILYALDRMEMCVCDLACLLGASQSAVSHQLRVLRQANLVTYRREGRVVYYSLADEHVTTIYNQAYEHIHEEDGDAGNL